MLVPRWEDADIQIYCAGFKPGTVAGIKSLYDLSSLKIHVHEFVDDLSPDASPTQCVRFVRNNDEWLDMADVVMISSEDTTLGMSTNVAMICGHLLPEIKYQYTIVYIPWREPDPWLKGWAKYVEAILYQTYHDLLVGVHGFIKSSQPMVYT